MIWHIPTFQRCSTVFWTGNLDIAAYFLVTLSKKEKGNYCHHCSCPRGRRRLAFSAFIERARGTGLVCAGVLETSLFAVKKPAPAKQATIILLLRDLAGCSGD